MNVTKRILLFILLFVALPVTIFAQGCVDPDQSPCKSIGDISQRAECFRQSSDACSNQGKTLTSQINYMNNQIQLTTLRIESTKSTISTLLNEISQLEDEVQRLEGVLTTRLALLIHRIPESYKRSSTPQFGMLLFSQNFSDFVTRAKYMMTVQQEDAALVFQVKATQNNYNERKDLREKKKAQLEEIKAELERQNIELAQQKQAKDALLTQTKGQEATYQQLYAQAKAQLEGFASFATSQGGGLLSGQTHCDDWGCYYNQRDSQWGLLLINGSNDCGGPCSLSRVGCLITSVAMVASHLGHRDISPADIAVSDPNNFSVGTAMLRFTINVKGVTISRIGSSLSPDNVKDQPVVVGVRYGPFGTHFVVVKSYSDGKYIMNDPYQENGHDKVFTDSYSLGSIFEVDRISI